MRFHPILCSIAALTWLPAGFANDQVNTAGTPASAPNPDQNRGFYTDEPSYSPGDVIKIHANWQPTSARYHLFRITGSTTAAYPTGAGHWEWVAESDPSQAAFYRAQAPGNYGSFVEFPSFSLEGRNRFTLCGWILPSNNVVPTGSSFGDIGVAGQLAHGNTPAGSAGIGIDEDGCLYGWVNNTRATISSPLPCIGGPNQFSQDDWLFVALTYGPGDGGNVIKLWTFEPFVTSPGGVWTSASATTTGAVASNGLPFRIGSKSDALTGAQYHRFSGRIDNWTVWDQSLILSQLKQVKNGKKPNAILQTPMPIQIPKLCPLLDVRFEDAYGDTVTDSSGNGHTGTIFNHGTPGVQGHNAGSALRLNHDQLVDTAWPALPEAEITIPAGARSGLYVVAGLGAGAVGRQSPFPGLLLSTVPWRSQCIAIRPERDETARIAVIVPVSTWTAYSGWPGRSFSSYTATGAAARLACSTVINGQGNNSAYNTYGDGVSRKLFVGWKRPKLTASPFGGGPDRNLFSVLAPGAIRFIEWIDREFGGVTGGVPEYDVYTDWDLGDASRLDLTQYESVVLICHTEYVTEEAVQALDAHLQSGGNILNIAANMLLWRIQLDRDSGIFEIRRWPAESGRLGPRDVISIMAGNGLVETGARRFLYQAVDAGGDPELDYMLGTIADTAPSYQIPDQFGCWEVQCPNHWLFDGVTVATGDEIGLTNIGAGQGIDIYALGHEADSFFPDRCPPGAMNIEVLAHGAFTGEQATMAGVNEPSEFIIDWTSTLMHGATSIYTANFAALDAIPVNFWGPGSGPPGSTWRPRLEELPMPIDPRGQILTYEHTGGGRVVSIPSTAATWTLGVQNGAQEDPVNAIVRNALECFLMMDCGALQPSCEEVCTSR